MPETNGTKARQTGRRDWRPAFLAKFRETGTVYSACKASGVARSHVYRERQSNEEFALAWADVEEDLVDTLEQKALEVALTGEVRMLEFLLRHRRPERYRENVKVTHGGDVRVGVVPILDGRDPVQLPAADREKAARLLLEGATDVPVGSGDDG